MPQNKNHHYVPQFYLRRFGSGGAIALYNLKRRKHVPCASIPGQCQKPYLYGKDQVIERSLCDLETDAAHVIAAILNEDRLPAFATREDAALVRFVAFQWGRTPAAGEIIEATGTKMDREVLKTPGFEKIVDDSKARRVDPVKFGLYVASHVVATMADLQKCILRNETDVEFIASDAPVVLHNMWCEGVTWQGTTGFTSAGLQILLPLNPRRLLFMFDPSIYAIGCKQRPVAVPIKHRRDVETLNEMQMTTAQGNLFYSGDASTAASIDRMPTRWWKPQADRVSVDSTPEASDGSRTIRVYQNSDAKLSLSLLRILKKARSVPLRMRPGPGRELAIMAYQFHQEEHEKWRALKRLEARRAPGTVDDGRSVHHRQTHNLRRPWRPRPTGARRRPRWGKRKGNDRGFLPLGQPPRDPRARPSARGWAWGASGHRSPPVGPTEAGRGARRRRRRRRPTGRRVPKTRWLALLGRERGRRGRVPAGLPPRDRTLPNPQERRMRLLKRTQRGPDVGRWQRFLIDQGLLDGAADGIFGEQTDAATRAFQAREGLDVDGIVGPNTLGRAEARGLVTFRRLRDAEVTPPLAVQANADFAPGPIPLGVRRRRHIGTTGRECSSVKAAMFDPCVVQGAYLENRASPRQTST